MIGRDVSYFSIRIGAAANADGFWPAMYQGGTIYNGLLLSPDNASPRILNIARTFQFYAFRKLRITYIPHVGTTTFGSIALGYSANSNVGNLDTTYAVINPTEVMELNPSVMSPVWQPFTMEITHNGTKVWSVQQNADTDQYNEHQGDILAVITNGTANGNYGQLIMEYVLDLYEQCAPLTEVSKVKECKEKEVLTSNSSSSSSSSSERFVVVSDSETKVKTEPKISEDYLGYDRDTISTNVPLSRTVSQKAESQSKISNFLFGKR